MMLVVISCRMWVTYAEHPVVKWLQADLCQETQASRFKAACYCGHSAFSVEGIEECCIADTASRGVHRFYPA